jgi:hypothetical protein
MPAEAVLGAAPGLNLRGKQMSAGQSPSEKRQAFVHSVSDAAVIVRELLLTVRYAKLVHPPHESAGTVEQIELILLAAVNVERLPPAEIVLCWLKIDDQTDGVSISAVIRGGFDSDAAMAREFAKAGHVKIRDAAVPQTGEHVPALAY